MERKETALSKNYQFHLETKRAKVLAEDDWGEIFFAVAEYGKGKVYFLNFPLEEMLLTQPDGLMYDYHKLYQTAAEGIQILRENPDVGITIHTDEKVIWAVLVNFTGAPQAPCTAWRILR